MDAVTLLTVRGTDSSWYGLCDRGNGTACVYVLCVVDDINATGIQSMIDAHGGTIPGSVVEGTLPTEDPENPGTYLPNHQSLLWLPPDDGKAQVDDVTVDATGGTWTLTVRGQVTGALAWDISAVNLQTALAALVPGTTVTGGPGGTAALQITWGAWISLSVSTDPANLTGGAGTAVVGNVTASGALQSAAVAFLNQGIVTSPQPRWVLSEKERELVGLPPSP